MKHLFAFLLLLSGIAVHAQTRNYKLGQWLENPKNGDIYIYGKNTDNNLEIVRLDKNFRECGHFVKDMSDYKKGFYVTACLIDTVLEINAGYLSGGGIFFRLPYQITSILVEEKYSKEVTRELYTANKPGTCDFYMPNAGEKFPAKQEGENYFRLVYTTKPSIQNATAPLYEGNAALEVFRYSPNDQYTRFDLVERLEFDFEASHGFIIKADDEFVYGVLVESADTKFEKLHYFRYNIEKKEFDFIEEMPSSGEGEKLYSVDYHISKSKEKMLVSAFIAPEGEVVGNQIILIELDENGRFTTLLKRQLKIPEDKNVKPVVVVGFVDVFMPDDDGAYITIYSFDRFTGYMQFVNELYCYANGDSEENLVITLESDVFKAVDDQVKGRLVLESFFGILGKDHIYKVRAERASKPNFHLVNFQKGIVIPSFLDDEDRVVRSYKFSEDQTQVLYKHTKDATDDDYEISVAPILK